MATKYDAVVIGGGFYGLYLAEYLAAHVSRVVLCERQEELMQRASYVNQARVHNGYHYPRSILTALRSRVNFPRFVEEFRPAIDDTFDMVYAVSRVYSKVTAQQFYRSMRRIEASIQPAPKAVCSLFDTTYVEGIFLTKEYAFNAKRLRQLMADRAQQAGIEVRLATEVHCVRPSSAHRVEVEVEGNDSEVLVADHVFCCGYAQLNGPGVAGGLSPVLLKHEIAELALVEVPDQLRKLGVTVMDGPFFSLMPFPARGLHSLSHVRYTPHAHWYDDPGQEYQSAYARLAHAKRQSAFPYMRRDAARYLPAVADCVHRDSLWEVKTVLPRSETDDSRPILFKSHFGFPNYHLVMGAKIDNVYDIADVVGYTCGWSHEAG